MLAACPTSPASSFDAALPIATVPNAHRFPSAYAFLNFGGRDLSLTFR